MAITEKQAQKLGLEPRSHLSPVLEKCSLRLCANESYQNAELELEALIGVKMGHSTLHRLVNRQNLLQPSALQAVSEVSLDGGKVRLRTPKGQECEWRDYKAARLRDFQAIKSPSTIMIIIVRMGKEKQLTAASPSPFCSKFN